MIGKKKVVEEVVSQRYKATCVLSYVINKDIGNGKIEYKSHNNIDPLKREDALSMDVYERVHAQIEKLHPGEVFNIMLNNPRFCDADLTYISPNPVRRTSKCTSKKYINLPKSRVPNRKQRRGITRMEWKDYMRLRGVDAPFD
jgi:hypothetical protein